MLDIRQLKIVDAIVRTGTVTKAAEALFVTQSAVSHGLRQLESRLEVKLFRRETRRMVPTDEGERLYETARTVLAEVARVEADLSQYRNGARGVVRLATGCYTCYHWLPRIIDTFTESFPGVELQIAPKVTHNAAGALKAGQLDLAILQTEEDDPDISLEPLFSDELLAIMYPGHPLAEKPFLTAEDFADETLLVHIDYEDSAYAQRILGPAGVEPGRVIPLTLTEAILESVKAKLGIAVMAEWVVGPEIESGRLRGVRLTSEGLARTWYLATESGTTSAPILELKRLLQRDAVTTVRHCAIETRGS